MIAIEHWASAADRPVLRNARTAHRSKVVQLKPMAQTRSDDLSGEQAALLRAVAAGDREAYAELFAYFAPRIKAMMMRGGLAPTPAEDVAQDAMLLVWRKAHLFDAEMGSPAAWIFTIARNRQIDLSRRARRAPTESQDADFEQVDDEPLPDAKVAAAQVDGKVRAAVLRLSAEQQQVLQLSFFEGQSQSEIAESLGIPLGTVKSRTRLAFQRLRALLGEFK